ncbi:MAG: histidinol-phosphate transaminase, partial [Candidatus Heimdallarchaeota archaeon]|nr:histidinol-phosphate transaminase [Candidatus Heimdallarchaeota archaeon]
YNRYPDPIQRRLKNKIADWKRVAEDQIFLGNGSDEAIDLMIRAFCQPGRDCVIIMPPTYGMFAVCADLNDVRVINISLTEEFDVDLSGVISHIGEWVKLIFICSPNNPTGNIIDPVKIQSILDKFDGLVVIDEAYIDFSSQSGWLEKISEYENLIILQTFSKAWGLANLRLGMAFGDQRIIEVLNKIKYPYNISGLTQNTVLEAFKHSDKKDLIVSKILKQRHLVQKKLMRLGIVLNVFPSEANFLLVQFKNSQVVYNYLLDKKIIVRDRSNVIRCDGCLRITVGTVDENQLLLKYLKEMDQST